MSVRRAILVLAVLLVSSGRASAGLRDGPPSWTTGESLDFPKHMYVTGVGVADDRPTAEDRARAEVSRVFSSHVVATTSSYASETGRVANGAATTESERRVSDAARISTQKELIGVEIGAVWTDPATRQTYALAVLDRRKAAARVEAELERLDGAAQRLAAEIGGKDRLAAGLAGLRHRGLQKRRAPLLADLQVLSGKRDESGAAALDAAASAAVGRLAVAVSVKDDPGQVLTTGVVRGLNSAGVAGRAEGAAAEPDLVVGVEGQLEDLGKRDGWYWARATATVVVREAKSGKVLLQLDDAERQSATLAADAPARARKALAARLANRIPAELVTALDSTGQQ